MSGESLWMHIRKAWNKTFDYNPSGEWKKPLYLITLVLQAPAVVARWMLAYAVLWFLGFDLIIGRSNAAALFAVAPLIWSFSAFWFPDTGWLWHRQRGAREPNEFEEIRYAKILDGLGGEAWDIASRVELVVLDHSDRMAFGRGVTYVISSGLLESAGAKPVTAHELYHFISGGARLSQALERLVWWRDPYRSLSEEGKRQNWLVRFKYFLQRWFFRVAGGGLILEYGPMRWLWARSYRKEEEAADEFAAKIGQGLSLAKYLKKYELPRARPRRRGWIDHSLHPFVAHRIPALRRMAREFAGGRTEGG